MSDCTPSQRALPGPSTVDLWSVPTTSRDVRSRRLARRSWLRQVLSEYVGEPPGALQFRLGAHGKPRLAQPGPVHFSMTSTPDVVVLGVATSLVGVDAEPLSGSTSFLRRWTTEEAVTKAIGCGVGSELVMEIDWSTADPRVVRLGHDDPAAWTLTSRVLAGDTLVSVAARTAPVRLNPCSFVAVDAHEAAAS